MNINRVSSNSSVCAVDTHPRSQLESSRQVCFGADDVREFYSSEPPCNVSLTNIQAQKIQRQLSQHVNAPVSTHRPVHQIEIQPEVSVPLLELARPPLLRRLAQKAFLACAVCVLPTICLVMFLGPIGLAVPAGLLVLSVIFGALGKKG